MHKYLQNTLKNSSSPYLYQKVKDHQIFFSVLRTDLLFGMYACVIMGGSNTKELKKIQKKLSNDNTTTYKKM